MVDALAVDTGVDRAELQRRTLRSLRYSQVPGQAATAGMVAVVSLLASDMLGSDRLAGMGSAPFTVGAAFTAIPLAAFMRRRGRRVGLTRALLIGAVGAAIASTGGQLRWFPLFVVGMLAFGAGQAATLQQRYVAADLAEPDQQGASIAAIVWVGTLGAALGPLLTPFEKSVATSPRPRPTHWSVRLRNGVLPDRCDGHVGPPASRSARSDRRHRPARRADAAAESGEVVGLGDLGIAGRLGLAAMAASQAAMVAVMTMTPPHMKDHDHANLSAFVIAVHIVGMYGLAPFVGRLVDRVGAVRAIQIGAVILGAGTVTTVLAGYVPALMFVGLFLPGSRVELRPDRWHHDPHGVGAGDVTCRGAGHR